MKNLTSRGLLSVEDFNALFEERLRVNLPGGSFKVIQRSYNRGRGCQVYEQHMPVLFVIYLQPEGHITPLNRVSASKTNEPLAKGYQAN